MWYLRPQGGQGWAQTTWKHPDPVEKVQFSPPGSGEAHCFGQAGVGWSCWANTWPHSGVQAGEWTWEIRDLGVCWESLRPYEQEDLEACSPSRALVSMLRGLQKGYSQASPLPPRMTVFWARACAGSAKCPHTHAPSF